MQTATNLTYPTQTETCEECSRDTSTPGSETGNSSFLLQSVTPYRHAQIAQLVQACFPAEKSFTYFIFTKLVQLQCIFAQGRKDFLCFQSSRLPKYNYLHLQLHLNCISPYKTATIEKFSKTAFTFFTHAWKNIQLSWG